MNIHNLKVLTRRVVVNSFFAWKNLKKVAQEQQACPTNMNQVSNCVTSLYISKSPIAFQHYPLKCKRSRTYRDHPDYHLQTIRIGRMKQRTKETKWNEKLARNECRHFCNPLMIGNDVLGILPIQFWYVWFRYPYKLKTKQCNNCSTVSSFWPSLYHNFETRKDIYFIKDRFFERNEKYYYLSHTII